MSLGVDLMEETTDAVHDWRKETKHLAGELERAHDVVEAMGTALDEADDAGAKSVEAVAHDAVVIAAQSVKNLTTKQRQPSDNPGESDALGSTLAVAGGGVATVALDVMVNAMAALATTDDNDDTEFLVGASLDAESAYEVGTAVVQASTSADLQRMVNLQRTLDTGACRALRERLIRSRPRVQAMKERAVTG